MKSFALFLFVVVLLFACGEKRDSALHEIPPLEDVLTLELSFGAEDLPEEFLFSALPEDQEYVAVSGQIIVWQQNFDDDWDLYAADISDPSNPDVFAVATDTSAAMHPAIDGHLIVCRDDRNGDWDIYGYNLTTRQEFIISDNQPGQQVFSNQTYPSISGNTVVWEDDLGSEINIYAALLDGPEIADCPERLPGDANGDCIVNLQDFLLVAQNWLTCNLDQPGACP